MPGFIKGSDNKVYKVNRWLFDIYTGGWIADVGNNVESHCKTVLPATREEYKADRKEGKTYSY